ncbi:MAG: SRPBCC family protein [Gemmatimonadota bacterium]
MVTTIVIVVLALIAALLLFAATRPDSFRLVRSATIKAPADKVFPLIADFHRWTAWSPWENRDPDLKRTYSGAESGKGAVYEWEGKKTGTGRMEITDTLAPSKVIIKLDFFSPFEAHNTTEFTTEGRGDSTTVTWAMSGRNNYTMKLVSIFMNMDKVVGKDFETGLANMKAVAEKS